MVEHSMYLKRPGTGGVGTRHKNILVEVDGIAVTTQFVEQFVPDKQKTIRNWIFSCLLYISNKQIAYNVSNYDVSLVVMNTNNVSCSILVSLQITTLNELLHSCSTY